MIYLERRWYRSSLEATAGHLEELVCNVFIRAANLLLRRSGGDSQVPLPNPRSITTQGPVSMVPNGFQSRTEPNAATSVMNESLYNCQTTRCQE